MEIRLENGSHIFLEDTLHVLGLGCTLVLAKKLLGSKLIGQFDAHCMLFSRRSDNTLMIEASIKNRLYIVSKIVLEVDSMSFVTSVERAKPIPRSENITAFTAALISATTPTQSTRPPQEALMPPTDALELLTLQDE